jgi:hypothetical protein
MTKADRYAKLLAENPSADRDVVAKVAEIIGQLREVGVRERGYGLRGAYSQTTRVPNTPRQRANALRRK